MADRYPYWVHEQHPDHRGPTSAKTLILFAIVTVVLLSMLGGPSYLDRVEQGNRHKPATLCGEHHGRPGWAQVCPQTPPR